MTTLEQLKAEAAEVYPTSDPRPTVRMGQFARQQGYVRKGTINAEQLEAAAKAHHAAEDTTDTTPWEIEPLADDYRRCARAAFCAAGFHVEGDDDD